MKYFAHVTERGSSDEANQLLGAPKTTLTRWCEQQLAAAAAS